MTINSALLAGVTGLVSNSSALAAISDNIANANTVGYKRAGVDFSSLVNGGSKSAYAAGGVSTAVRNFITQQGTLQASANVTDLAISGDGFFVGTPKALGVGPTEPREFTRAGSFTIDEAGYLKNAAGLFLQGWPADANGVVHPDSANLSSLGPINLLSTGGTASATTTSAIDANLDSDQVVNSSVGSYSAGSMAAYAATAGASGMKPDFSFTVPVSDSKGGQRNLVVDLMKSADPNGWHVEVRADPPSDLDPSANPDPNGMIANASGDIGFTSLGAYDPTFVPSSGSLMSTNLVINWNPSLGVATQNIALDLSGMSQFSGVSSVGAVKTNGTAFGGVSGVSIDKSGNVTAVYENGSTRQIARVAVATFPNPNGLRSVSGNAFQASLESGAFTLKTAGTAGAGDILPSSLEASTVDLSAEFTGLITTQRAYSASSKIITTADEMLQELLNIKR